MGRDGQEMLLGALRKPVDEALPQLRSNGEPLSNAPNRLGWLPSHSPDEDLATLRTAFDEQGVLLVKGLLPARDVLALRHDCFAYLRPSGLIRPGTPSVEGIVGSDLVDYRLAEKLLMEFVRSTRYERFCLHEKLVSFVDELLGDLSFLHKRKILRYTKPSDPSSTGAHYDLVYIRGGTERLLTAWIPIGDVPVEMGGLVYLEGSHAVGRRMEAEFTAKNAELSPEERVSAYNKNMNEGGWLTKKLSKLADKFDARWLMANYEAGDVAFHSPYMIHAATANESSEGRLRLSTDIRFQSVRDAIDPRWQEHWSLGDKL